MLVATFERTHQARSRPTSSYLRHWACVFGLAASDGAAFGLAELWRMRFDEPHIVLADGLLRYTPAFQIDIFLVLAILFVLYRAIAGDYTLRIPFWDSVTGTLGALTVTALPDVACVLLRPGRYAVGAALASWLFLIVAIPAFRQLTRFALARLGIWFRQTVLIGGGTTAKLAYTALHASLSLGFDIRQCVLIDPAREAVPALASLKRISSQTVAELGELVHATGCDQAIVALDEDQRGLVAEAVQRLNEAGVETAIIPAMEPLPFANFSTNVVLGRNILLLQTRDNFGRWPQRALKRTFDIVAALGGLVVLAPLIFYIAALIKRRESGPVFYVQTRIGRGGEPFHCYKFRTMAIDAEERLQRWRSEEPQLYEQYVCAFKLQSDPRVTPLGEWLRSTSLDELPQLVNILRGDMSFVGPRPVIERELAEFYGPAARLYMRVRPGLTGLWQISGRSNTTYAERIAFDEWYILNWSFWYDIIILVQTLRTVIAGRGAV